MGAAPDHRHEDELSIAMLAFYEAILGYAKSRGAFLPYARPGHPKPLIDYTRKERRHQNLVSLHTPNGRRTSAPGGHPAHRERHSGGL